MSNAASAAPALSLTLQRVANVPEHPPPSIRLMPCARVANRHIPRIIGANWDRGAVSLPRSPRGACDVSFLVVSHAASDHLAPMARRFADTICSKRCHANGPAPCPRNTRAPRPKSHSEQGERRYWGLSFSLPSNEMCYLVTFTFAMLFSVLVHAAQVIPSGVEYTNDTLEQGGKLVACIVTTAIISPPAPEIVNFQVLVIGGTHAFKVTAGDVDWTNGSGAAKRISAADFSTAQFNHPTAFKKSVTSEGQLVGYLRQSNLNGEFLKAFFGGRYTIRFMRTDQKDERTYYIEQAPESDVTNAFRLCLGSMRETR